MIFAFSYLDFLYFLDTCRRCTVVCTARYNTLNYIYSCGTHVEQYSGRHVYK